MIEVGFFPCILRTRTDAARSPSGLYRQSKPPAMRVVMIARFFCVQVVSELFGLHGYRGFGGLGGGIVLF